MMDNKKVARVSKAIIQAIESSDDPALKGLSFSKHRVVFRRTGASITIEVLEPFDEKVSQSDDQVKAGLGFPGTLVQCPLNAKGIIVKARQKKYLIKGTEGKWAGENYLVRFEDVSLVEA